VIKKIEFSAKNLTSNAGLFLLLEHANKNGIFDPIDHDLVFDNASTNKIKMNHDIDNGPSMSTDSFDIIRISRLFFLELWIYTTVRKD